MIETPFAVDKFSSAVNKLYPENAKIERIINAETITCFKNFDKILEHGKGFLTGVTVGRSDLSASMGIAKKDIECEKVICIANEEDAKNVFGIEVDNTNVYEGKINKAGYKDVAEKMYERFGLRYIAFTLRTSHSATANDWTGMLYDGKQFYNAKEYHISNIVDRLGGGDSFGAGLIYGIRKGYDCQKIIEFAAASSALKHSIEGDFNRISVPKIEKLMSGDASGRVQR